jgi:Domain of unknown function (DUF4376)
MKYVQFDEIGNIVSFCDSQQEIDISTLPQNMAVAPEGMNSQNAFEYIVNGQTREAIYIGKKPSHFYRYSFEEKCWVVNRITLIEEIDRACNKQRQETISTAVFYEGNVFDADGIAVFNLQSTLTMCMNGVSLPENFVWRDSSNNNVPMSLEKLKGLAQTIFERNNLAYMESWKVKDSLSSKTDEELLAIHNDLTNK